MSLTNSAFMKAYDQSPASTETARGQPSAANQDPARKQPTEKPASSTPVPAPHFDVTAQIVPDDVSDGATTQPAAEPTERIVALPLSSYLGTDFLDTARANSAANTAAPESLIATRHVERFHWPEVCRSISRVAGSSIDAIARSVLQASANGKKMFAVTGCRRGEGRTTLLQCVARALRTSDVSVALIDADVHRPALAKRLGVQPEIGWDDVLLGTRQLPEALVCSQSDRLTLLPRRRPLGGEDETSQRMKQEVIFRMMRDQSDVVLFDTGPLLEDPDCGALWLAECDLIDAAIVVCDPHRNCTRRLSRVLEALEQRNIPPAGVVENFAAVAASSGQHLRRDAAGE